MRNLLNVNSILSEMDFPKVMGILNITSDSFYDGGQYLDQNSIINKIDKMIQDGADIIDVGACSTRPSAKLVSENEEISALTFALTEIRKKYPEVIISVDTFRSQVSKLVVEEFGVQIINDISGGNLDNKMFDTVAKLQVPYILMHMKGRPEMMQESPLYENDVLKEVLLFLSERVNHLNKSGVNDIIIDPGFGFGKTLEDNYSMLSCLEDFRIFELPLLIGVSRKSMVYNVLKTDAEGALNGTTALNMYALQKGASILRVHDVREAVETIKLYAQLNK